MPDPFVFKPDTNILQALEMDDRVVEALKSLGLKCIDKRQEACVAAEVETLADASRYHDIPLENILSALNRLGVVPKPPSPDPDPDPD